MKIIRICSWLVLAVLLCFAVLNYTDPRKVFFFHMLAGVSAFCAMSLYEGFPFKKWSMRKTFGVIVFLVTGFIMLIAVSCYGDSRKTSP